MNRSNPLPPQSTPAPAPGAHLDVLRVLCTQLIVWHHLAFYGPMSDVVLPHAEALISALYDHGRLAVQVFLVMGGFLAARSLASRLREPNSAAAPLQLHRLLWQRYLRLVPPMLLALLLAIVCAAVARQLMSHEATPEAPTWGQFLAHALLMHNILDIEGLSAGVWYIAIDFQLYALMAAWAWASRQLATLQGGHALTWFWGGVTGLTLASLLFFNLQPELDVWAIYFFGAYGLGALAAGLAGRSGPQRDRVATVVLGALLALALLLEWRERILLAGLTSVALTLLASRSQWPGWMNGATMRHLVRISYAQFLVHYPIGLLVNAAVTRQWPDDPGLNALGMVLAWLASLGAAVWFQAVLDRLAATGSAWAAAPARRHAAATRSSLPPKYR